MTPKDFASYPTGNLCNADNRVRAVASSIKPLIPGKRIAGHARTVRISPGQNGAIHRAVHNASPDEMLVVDGGGSERYGPFGDLLADGCLAKGMTGAVFDCTIRDRADIAALGFQVFCRGFHPEATKKSERGEVDIQVVIGGTIVHPGDLIVGDGDGVVVIPQRIAPEVLERVAAVAAKEDEVRARIRSGESTIEIFNIDL